MRNWHEKEMTEQSTTSTMRGRSRKGAEQNVTKTGEQHSVDTAKQPLKEKKSIMSEATEPGISQESKPESSASEPTGKDNPNAPKRGSNARRDLNDVQISKLFLKLAEECTEVAHAVLKMAGDPSKETQEAVATEMGHVSAMFTHVLSYHLVDSKLMWKSYDEKHKKWEEKLNA